MARPGDLTRVVELPGPWTHRHVAANGARFHVAESEPGQVAADAPLVLLLHGFPQFWWSWRHQLPALAGAGYHAVAMDLRGYGGSDKTRDGYDPFTLAGDVVGVVKALGRRQAVLVGQGWGGYVAWAAAVLHPREVSALAVVSAPHPTVVQHAFRRGLHGEALRHVLTMQLPFLPERQLADPHGGRVAAHLTSWAAPGSGFPDAEAVTTYQSAISLWPASHCALEYHRWLVRSRLRNDGRAFARRLAEPVRQPVLALSGELDPAVPREAMRRSQRYVAGPMTERTLPGVGHFAPEEDPEALTAALLDWLAGLPDLRGR
ncbi:alpha/beta fold hydrolase [Nocardioides mesophilus]|uniref:Alpha/beta hydrolase n=1 Tax=Nocardioides mesophilus TaxID=433659 RepID=A0A7G9RGC9_9ACTN|nr:alpha/beta hydrolase [Nocardioides mesophilus]QNN54654.1 alpha/beta hydrolase [Nocardioides mesophilus]